jgi:bifunctional N-acetylglucosamine-1-phosphate-uridyltransferase/glucosamine-1-phosphate-acetyltransferase GlmU-like protein
MAATGTVVQLVTKMKEKSDLAKENFDSVKNGLISGINEVKTSLQDQATEEYQIKREELGTAHAQNLTDQNDEKSDFSAKMAAIIGDPNSPIIDFSNISAAARQIEESAGNFQDATVADYNERNNELKELEDQLRFEDFASI